MARLTELQEQIEELQEPIEELQEFYLFLQEQYLNNKENKQSTFRWFYCEKQGQIDFCKCEQCSLSNYGRDCQNNKIK